MRAWKLADPATGKHKKQLKRSTYFFPLWRCDESPGVKFSEDIPRYENKARGEVQEIHRLLRAFLRMPNAVKQLQEKLECR